MIHWLEDIDDHDTATVGTKAAALGSLMDGDTNVPRGFIIEASFFQHLLDENGYAERVQQAIERMDPDDRNDIERTSSKIHSWIDSIEFPENAVEDIEEAYEQVNIAHKIRNAGKKAVELVGGQRETAFVAVRGHDTDDNGFHETKLGINGKDAVIEAIREAWKSQYAPINLRRHRKTGDFTVLIQKMVEPAASGTAFTHDPLGTEDTLLIEATYGIGSALTDGTVIPDRFQVERRTGRTGSSDIAEKEWKIERDPSTGSTVRHRVPSDKQDEPSIDDETLETVTNEIEDIARQRTDPLKIDFAVGRNKIYILDIRTAEQADFTEIEEPDRDTLTDGIPASPGTGTGSAHILYDPADADPEDDAIIAGINASRDLHTIVNDVDGIVTEKGGHASDLATLARREGTPMIAGTGDCTDIMTDGETITLAAQSGTIYEGAETSQETGQHMPDEDALDTRSITATNILTVNETVEDADGTVAMRYSDVKDPDWVLEAGQPDRRIHQEMKDSFQGGGFLVETYASILRLEEARERDVDHVFLDVRSLQNQGSRQAVERAIEEAATAMDGSCSIILDTPDDDLIHTSVRAGVDSLVVPPEQFSTFQTQLERAERSFILERLRDL